MPITLDFKLYYAIFVSDLKTKSARFNSTS